MAAARVSIPAAVRRTIQDIKEIAGDHADEEVYAVLRECSMDPNETAQRLLHRGTFHEVKRKRDKKKESRKESADPRWRPGMQGRDVKGGQGNYSSRQLGTSNDLSGRKPLPGKEIGVNQNMDKGSSPFVNPDTETKTSTSSLSLPGGLSNGPSQPVAPIEKNSSAAGHLRTSDSKRSADLEDTKEIVATSVPDVSQSIQPPPSISGLCMSSLSPIPSPSLEARSHGEICSTKHDFGSLPAAGVPDDTSRPSSSYVQPSGSRPSSSYSSNSQQLNVSQKDWKMKSTSKHTQAENRNCEDVPINVETVPQSVPVLNSVHKEDLSLQVDKRRSEMQLSDKQHVIIPDHLQVTESEKYGLSFGSFGTSFEPNVPKGPSEDDSSQELYEVVSEPAMSCQGASSSIHIETDQDVDQLHVEMTDDSLPQRADSSSYTPEVAGSDLAKDSSAASHIPQDSVAQTTTSYSTFALAPQIHGNPIPLLETSESQVHQTNDFPASYHAQLYRPIADVDGRLSPFAAPGAGIKYGNVSVLPAQTGEAQEGINSQVLSSSGSAPLATPASGVVPSSTAITQAPAPLFHQPGVQLSHYAPSFIPYNQYISPFYFPPYPLPHLMGNAAAFPQPPSTGSMYPPVSAAVAQPVKYSSTTYKPDDNTGSQTHVGIPGAYAIYGSSPSVYTNNMVVANGTSVDTDDVIGSQIKENNSYVVGQQSDGSTVWIPAPGRDVSGLQPTSFYGLPPQGQHLAFAPAQAGHGAFAGMYHPVQTMAGAAVHPLLQPSQTIAGAVEMVGPPATGYQQPQRAQMNWGHY